MSGGCRLVWGLVGGLSFLVLVQGYELVVGVRVGLAVKGAVSAGVGVVTIVLLPPVTRRLDDNGSA